MQDHRLARLHEDAVVDPLVVGRALRDARDWNISRNRYWGSCLPIWISEDGNAVANTYTLNESFGSRYVVEGAGFLLNDEMDDFSIKPGVPNVYGLVGGTANAIAPGKRMLSSMAPTIVTRDGKLFLVIGSPGGSRIITSICEAMINVIDHGMNVADAVGAPRFHSQWLPDRVDIGLSVAGTTAGDREFRLEKGRHEWRPCRFNGQRRPADTRRT